MMKVLVYDNSGHPFQVQLSRTLAKRGYDVFHVFSASFQTPKGSLGKNPDDPPTFSIKGIRLGDVFEKYSFVKRWKQENQFGKLVLTELRDFKPDVLIASNVPLDTLKHVAAYCKRNKITFIFWVQDFYGIAIQKILKNKIPIIGNLIGRYYIRLEKKLLEKSDHIVLIAEEFQNVLIHMNVSNRNVSVIPNWSPLEEIPVEKKENEWSIQYKLNDKFCFFYTGTLGLKHNPELLFDLAFSLKDNDAIRIVIVSEGIGAEWLKKKLKEQPLSNLILLGFQPFEMLPKVMATADVLLAVLENDAGIYSVPSKILSYFCAQRALLLSVPEENLSAKIVSETDCGLVASPDNKTDFIRFAEKLYNDKQTRDKMALNARRYAEMHFEIDTITDKFIHIINNSGK